MLHDSATDSWEIGVKVRNNVATLRGKLVTMLERQKAVEETCEGGARWVRDKMKVK